MNAWREAWESLPDASTWQTWRSYTLRVPDATCARVGEPVPRAFSVTTATFRVVDCHDRETGRSWREWVRE